MMLQFKIYDISLISLQFQDSFKIQKEMFF